MSQFHGHKLVALLPLLFSSLILSTTRIAAITSAGSLDSTIRDFAFKDLRQHRRTGVLYQVPLPANLSGIASYVVRLRSKTLWSDGANFTAFHIPPRTTPIPYVRRLTIVYMDLGNWSSAYYEIPGYSLVTPVFGLLAYNASDTNAEIDFDVLDNPMLIAAPVHVELPKVIKCAKFGRDGSVQIGDIVTVSHACSTKSTGHFAIVVPMVVGRRWWFWLACGCGGVVGLALLGLVGMRIFWLVKEKGIWEMEVRASEGEVLGSVWIGGSKMPSATAMRTQPVLETGTTP